MTIIEYAEDKVARKQSVFVHHEEFHDFVVVLECIVKKIELLSVMPNYVGIFDCLDENLGVFTLNFNFR